MAQTIQLVQVLKRALKAHHITYADIARELELSEASIKRLFAENSFSLSRLDQICQMMDMEISDLVQTMNLDKRQLTQLNTRQEEEIAGDPVLLMVAVCALNRWSMEQILDHYYISEHQCMQALARLDRLKLIELLPGNRIKLRISPNFKWIENGPIQNFFLTSVEAEFFKSTFDKDTEKLICLNGMLSGSSNGILQRKLERLASEFEELNEDDASLDITRRFGTTMVLAIRQWQYGLFADMKK